MTLFKNGFHIINLYFPFYLLLQDHLLTSCIIFKLFIINYYIHYGHYNVHLSYFTKYIRPWVRFSDTGFYYILAYYFYEDSFYSIAYIINGAIFISYWVIMVGLSYKDNDQFNNFQVMGKIGYILERFMSIASHSLPFFLLHNDLCDHTEAFTIDSFYRSIKWLLIWLCFIYVPYVLITGDYIYSIMSNKTHSFIKFMGMLFVFFTAFISWQLGMTLHNQLCIYNDVSAISDLNEEVIQPNYDI
jgi:hypothetical protein